MKIETFFEKFELFAEAPGAVARIRGLVLELAVRGKLVEQLACSGREVIGGDGDGVDCKPLEIRHLWRNLSKPSIKSMAKERKAWCCDGC